MNILFLTTHLNTGGITSYLYTLGKDLVERGHSIHVISSGGNCEESFREAGILVKNIDIKTKSELSLKIYGNLSQIKKYILENQIEVIHSQTRITQVAGRLLKDRTRCKYISTCHGFFKPRLSRKLIPCWGDRVIAISDPVRTHLRDDFRVDPEKIDLIPNGIDLSLFSPVTTEKRNAVRERYSVGNDPVVGIIARLSDVKGQDILVSAFQKVASHMPQAKLLLVGEGKMEPILKQQVAQMQLEKNVRFIPVINHTADMLPLFDVFVMPSRQEGLGLSVMEAQAVGLPVIASNVGGLPSLIDSQQSGILVTPGDADELSAAIIDLLEDSEKAKRIGLVARKRAEAKYSSQVMGAKTLETYQKVFEKVV